MDPRVQGGGAGAGRRQDDAYGQKGKQEYFYGQRGKQVEEPNGGQQRGGRQEDSYAQRAKQADEPYGGQQRGGRPDGEKREKQQAEEPFGGGGRGWGNDSGVAGRGKQQLDPFGSSIPSRGGQESPRFQQEPQRLATAKEPYAQLDFNEPSSHVSPYHGGHAELHAAPGAPVNPALHTMVKMVTMLNFMKVSNSAMPTEDLLLNLVPRYDKKMN